MKKCLNLACSNMPIKSTEEEHWINSDKFYYPATFEKAGSTELNPEHGKPEDYDWEEGDFTTDLKKYSDYSIDKVWIIHGLEHTYWDGAVHTLKEIYRILKPEGEVEIEVPDLAFAFNFDVSTMIDMIFGGKDENSLQFGHNCGFTRKILHELMVESGFQNIKVVTETDKNIRLRGTK
jgi:predicted SAM-dependent methyltransferase